MAGYMLIFAAAYVAALLYYAHGDSYRCSNFRLYDNSQPTTDEYFLHIRKTMKLRAYDLTILNMQIVVSEKMYRENPHMFYFRKNYDGIKFEVYEYYKNGLAVLTVGALNTNDYDVWLMEGVSIAKVTPKYEASCF